MDKIRLLQRTMCGGELVYPGNVVNAEEGDAKYLVALGKAEPAPKAAKVTGPKAPGKANAKAKAKAPGQDLGLDGADPDAAAG